MNQIREQLAVHSKALREASRIGGMNGADCHALAEALDKIGVEPVRALAAPEAPAEPEPAKKPSRKRTTAPKVTRKK